MCMRRINILSNHEDNVRKSQQDDAQRKFQYGMMLIDPRKHKEEVGRVVEE